MKKRVLFIAAAVFVVLAGIAAMFPGDKGHTAASPSPTIFEEAAIKPSASPEPASPSAVPEPSEEQNAEPSAEPSEAPSETVAPQPSKTPEPIQSAAPTPGQTPESSEEPQPTEEPPVPSADPQQAFRELLKQYNYVGSRESDKYHYPTCRWTSRINDQNLIYWDTVEEARAAGTCHPK